MTDTPQKSVPNPSPTALESADRPKIEKGQQVQTLQRAPCPLAQKPDDLPFTEIRRGEANEAQIKIRPQSSPKLRLREPSVALDLSRADVRYLIGVLEREVGFYSLAQQPGLHAHNFAKRLRRVLE